MAIAGIGTDIVAIVRISEILQRSTDRFAQRILSETEWLAYQRLSEDRPRAHFLAKRFAAKEAAAKALGTGMRQGVAFNQFSVLHDTLGKPQLVLTGAAQQLAKQQGIQHIHLSITDEHHYACAMVIMEK